MSLLGNLVTSNGVELHTFTFASNNFGNSTVTVTGVKAGDIVLVAIDLDDNNYPVPFSTFRYIAPSDDTLYQGGVTNGQGDVQIVVVRP